MSFTPREVKQLPQAWRDRDESTLDRLRPMVYDEQRPMPQWFMRNERTFGQQRMTNDELRMTNDA